MGLIRKAAWLTSGGIVRPTSKEEKRHAELLTAIQGKDAKTVHRAGGRYDASNLLGGTPDGTPLLDLGDKTSCRLCGSADCDGSRHVSRKLEARNGLSPGTL
jgi:hypothetical protein